MKYKIYFQMSPTQPNPFHNSYIKYVEELVEPFLQKELKKHRHPFGNYVASVMFYFKVIESSDKALILCRNHKLTVWLNFGECHMGSMEIDFDSDNMVYEKETKSQYINPLEDISKFNPKFKITDANILPSEVELEKQSQRMYENFIKSFNQFRFPCEIIAENYPDVVYEIEFEENGIGDKIYAVVEQWAYKYNKRREKDSEGIHFVQCLNEDIDNMKTNAVYIHIDFGNCSPLLIKNVISALNKTELAITNIVVR